METITMCFGADHALAPNIVFRLEDGLRTFYHPTGVSALLEDIKRDHNGVISRSATNRPCAKHTP